VLEFEHMANEKLLHYVRKSGRAPNDEKLIGYPEMAAQIGIATRTLRYWVSCKKVPHLKFGHKTVKFLPSKVRNALERFEIEAATRK
jgi:hypothetical protein